jgi:hypothetical protein
MALTNLNGLQEKYRGQGLIVAAISDESPMQLKDFVRARGAEINFSVAADDLARKTTAAYQNTFKQSLMPRAYLVGKDGRVLWIGHPLRDGVAEVVDGVFAGQYNLEQTEKEVLAREQLDGYLGLARQNDARTRKAGIVMLVVRTNDAAGLCEFASRIATDEFIEHRDFAVARRALERSEQISATNVTDIAVTRAILTYQEGKIEDALAQARQALAGAHTEADKEEVNICIRAMEARRASAAAPANAPVAEKTNAPAVTP